MTDSDAYESDMGEVKKRCNWCNALVKLVPNKPYCGKCSRNCFRECRRCHRPFPNERHFEKDENRCNACHEKYLKEREKRLEAKKRKEMEKKAENISSSEDNEEVITKKRFVMEKKPQKEEKMGKQAAIIIPSKKKKYIVVYETDDIEEQWSRF